MDSMTRHAKPKIQMGRGKEIVFKLVPIKNVGDIKSPSMAQIDDLVIVDVYEGYRKLGRYKLGDARLKFK